MHNRVKDSSIQLERNMVATLRSKLLCCQVGTGKMVETYVFMGKDNDIDIHC